MIDKGVLPDMVSYGVGINFPNLNEINTDKNFYGGMVSGKTFALPWCKGAYVLLKNSNVNKKRTNTLVVSLNDYNLSTTVLALEDLKYNEYKTCSPLEAYIGFVGGEYEYLLGTQRDVVRVNNRGFSCEIIPLDSFCDLYQYISNCTTNVDKHDYVEKFINFLMSEKIQSSLDKISMLSEFYDVKYQIESLNQLKKIKPKSTISAFSSIELIEDIKNNANLILGGDTSAISKIKNVLILP
jgi:hypothetical protein